MPATTIRLHTDHWSKISLHNQVIWFKGFIEADGQYYGQTEIEQYFTKFGFSYNDVKKWTGNFALICSQGLETILAADRVRSIPLFYYMDQQGNWVVTDQLSNEPISGELDDVAVYEFLLTGYVSGENTLYSNAFQLEAGQYVFIKGTEVKKEFYYSYYHHPEEEMDLESGANALIQVFYRVFERLAKRIGDRPVMLPLSGGFDSRIIALLLKETGVKRITSFSYGSPGNPEAKKSKEIAERLGFPWDFYPYSKNDWHQWYHSEEWKKYVAYSANFSTTPHLQDWPAVKQISDKSNEPFVFTPGHTGDFIAGAHLTDHFAVQKSFSLDDVVDYIMHKHHRLWKPKQNEVYVRIKDKIKSTLQGFAYENQEQASALFEYWDWRERQAKFIVHSLRVYEFFDHQWEIPLWDYELMEFFLKVPFRYRFRKQLYDYTLYKMFPNYFPKPSPQQTYEVPFWKKGILYEVLRFGYRYKLMLEQYHRHPLEWYGITGNYGNYLNQLSFRYKDKKFIYPYNINSFVSKDYIASLK